MNTNQNSLQLFQYLCLAFGSNPDLFLPLLLHIFSNWWLSLLYNCVNVLIFSTFLFTDMFVYHCIRWQTCELKVAECRNKSKMTLTKLEVSLSVDVLRPGRKELRVIHYGLVSQKVSNRWIITRSVCTFKRYCRLNWTIPFIIII